MDKLLYLILGGVLGTIARYYLSTGIYKLIGTDFPYGTLAVNLTGCFLIGMFAVLAEEKFMLDPNMKILLMVGFCGAFTTFSTFIYETAELAKGYETVKSIINVGFSVIFGYGAFIVGMILARTIWR